MNRETLFNNIRQKKSYLCIGLDSDPDKIPKHLLKYDDPVYEFNKQIIEATHDLCIAYKPNLAFYESSGVKGLQSLEKSMAEIPENIFTIADAKRGDIGNTATHYAKAFFENYNFDAVTVAPYMGKDSVTPFLQFKNKWAILLALTSNTGAKDFQTLLAEDEDEKKQLYEIVLRKSQQWGHADQLMFVTGATRAEYLANIRQIVPDHFLLVPGIGAQGGNLEQVSTYGMNKQCGLLVNSSRQIIFASAGIDFADQARIEALKLQKEMENCLNRAGLI